MGGEVISQLFFAYLPLITVLSSAFIAVTMMLIPESKSNIRSFINLLAAVLKISLLAIMSFYIYRGIHFSYSFELFAGHHFLLVADPLAMLFAILSAVLWLVTTVYALGYLNQNADGRRFFSFFSLCVTASIGVSFSGNLITFLIFYELLTLSTYPLVVHKGTDHVIKSGSLYLFYTLTGGVVLMIGTIFLASIAGDTTFSGGVILGDIYSYENRSQLQLLFWLLIAGVGVKAALFPFHAWLPIAMVAPAPVSALLHAVAVVKAGAFGIVRIIYDIFGVELFSDILNLSLGLVLLSSFTIIYGSLLALFQNDLKKRLAYSTVSQLSYIALGVAMAGPIASIGGLVHLVHQGLMKITLFFCAGNYAQVLNVKKINNMNGLGILMPLTSICFTVGALGMIGIPPIAGFVSKWYLAIGAIDSGHIFVLGVLLMSSFLNACYFLPILYRIWFLPVDNLNADSYRDKRDYTEVKTNRWLLLPTITTATFSIVTGVFASYSLSPLSWVKFILTEIYFL